MSLNIRRFIHCDSCDFRYVTRFAQWSVNPRDFLFKHVYRVSEGILFPLLKRQMWCLECHGFTNYELIPTEEQIAEDVLRRVNDIDRFERGETSAVGAPEAQHARLVVRNQLEWRSWANSRAEPRCLICGGTHHLGFTPDDLSSTPEGSRIAHPGCGGMLLFGEEEDERALYISWKSPGLNDPVRYTFYRPDGLPGPDLLEERRKQLERSYPVGYSKASLLLQACRDAVEHSKSLSRAPDHAARLDLPKEFAGFLKVELGLQAFDSNDVSALSRCHPKLFSQLALVVRTQIHSEFGKTP